MPRNKKARPYDRNNEPVEEGPHDRHKDKQPREEGPDGNNEPG